MRLPTQSDIEAARRAADRVPIVCCECAEECPEYGEVYARELGWQGFSYVDVKPSWDKPHRRERLGTCPMCKGGAS